MTNFSPKNFTQIEACISWSAAHGYEFAQAAAAELRRNLAAYGRVARAANVLHLSQVTVYDILKRENGKENLMTRLRQIGRADLADLFLMAGKSK